VTPAMEAGISDHVWSVEEITALKWNPKRDDYHPLNDSVFLYAKTPETVLIRHPTGFSFGRGKIWKCERMENKKIIIVDSSAYSEHHTWNWDEKPEPQSIPQAGIHPKVQQRLDAESSERKPMLGDVSFECDAPLRKGTVFSAKGESQQYEVSSNDGRKYWANRKDKQQ
jgi:hypothetical protein